MGIGWLEILLIVGIGLALFGPKTLQSLAEKAGNATGQARQMKDQIADGLPVDDIKKITNIPRNPRQVIGRLLTSQDADNSPQSTDKQNKPVTAPVTDQPEQSGPGKPAAS